MNLPLSLLVPVILLTFCVLAVTFICGMAYEQTRHAERLSASEAKP